MNKPLHLPSAADTAHKLALEIHRFTARWPECERKGLTLDVRRAARDLSSLLVEAYELRQGRSLLRAIDNARRKHARLTYLIRFATDLGYRKLSVGGDLDRMMSHLDIDLGILRWEAHDDPDLVMIDGVVQTSGWSSGEEVASGNAEGQQPLPRRRGRYR